MEAVATRAHLSLGDSFPMENGLVKSRYGHLT